MLAYIGPTWLCDIQTHATQGHAGMRRKKTGYGTRARRAAPCKRRSVSKASGPNVADETLAAAFRRLGRNPARLPDLRDPRVRAAIRREAASLGRHPENAAVDDWIDAACDWREI